MRSSFAGRRSRRGRGDGFSAPAPLSPSIVTPGQGALLEIPKCAAPAPADPGLERPDTSTGNDLKTRHQIVSDAGRRLGVAGRLHPPVPFRWPRDGLAQLHGAERPRVPFSHGPCGGDVRQLRPPGGPRTSWANVTTESRCRPLPARRTGAGRTGTRSWSRAGQAPAASEVVTDEDLDPLPSRASTTTGSKALEQVGDRPYTRSPGPRGKTGTAQAPSPSSSRAAASQSSAGQRRQRDAVVEFGPRAAARGGSWRKSPAEGWEMETWRSAPCM